MARRPTQPDWLKLAQADAREMTAFSGIPEEDCFRLLNPDTERDTEQVVKHYLMTPIQKQWLKNQDLGHIPSRGCQIKY